MEAILRKRKPISVYLWYTVFFVIAATLCFSFFVIYNKSMVWKNDGLYVNYNMFLSFGKWFREIIRNLISNHQLEIPLWNWSFMGGGDIIGYGLFHDPFLILSVFVPTKFSEFGYAFTVVFQLYLAGIAFCAYCKKWDCLKWTTVLAAIMYVFCSYNIFAAVRHPYFINNFIWIPLIFLGCEKIFRKESFVLFSVAVALSALCGFYFFYMIVILTVLYVAFRLLFDSELRNVKNVLKTILKLLFSSVIGVMSAAFLLLPAALCFAGNNSRVSSTYISDPFYSQNIYSAMPGLFLSTLQGANWQYCGMAPLVYIGVFGSFINRNKKEQWARIYLMLEIIFLLFPIFGRIFNGFGYVCNRWTFIWSFIPAFLFAKRFPDILRFSRKRKLFLIISCATYTTLCIVLERSRTEVVLVNLVFLMVSLLFAVIASNINDISLNSKRHKLSISRKRVTQTISAVMTVCFVFHFAYYKYSKSEENYLNAFHDSGTVYDKLTNERTAVCGLIKDNDFYRVENSPDNVSNNFLFSSGISSTSWYWSTNSIKSVEWRRMNSAYAGNNYNFVGGITSRAWLTPQYCAKYYTSSDTAVAKSLVPYGYELQGEAEVFSGKTYYLYRTDYSLPFGCTYDSVISKSDFENLSIVERQQASLQSCVVDDNVQGNFINSNALVFDDYEINYELNVDKNISIDDNLIYVKKSNSAIQLSFEDSANGELYVVFSGLNYTDGGTSTNITASCGKASSAVTHYTERHIYSEGRTEYVLNLGYSEKERNTITINFSGKGYYSFDSMKIICQPMEKLPEYVMARSEDTLENVEFSANKISGTINLDKSKFLCMSLPYSKGWTCYVDGQKTELLQANIAFSGLELQPGHHEIELEFCTPYLKTGAVLSVVGIVLIIAGRIMFKNKERIIQKIESARNHK